MDPRNVKSMSHQTVKKLRIEMSDVSNIPISNLKHKWQFSYNNRWKDVGRNDRSHSKFFEQSITDETVLLQFGLNFATRVTST